MPLVPAWSLRMEPLTEYHCISQDIRPSRVVSTTWRTMCDWVRSDCMQHKLRPWTLQHEWNAPFPSMCMTSCESPFYHNDQEEMLIKCIAVYFTLLLLFWNSWTRSNIFEYILIIFPTHSNNCVLPICVAKREKRRWLEMGGQISWEIWRELRTISLKHIRSESLYFLIVLKILTSWLA